MTVGIGEKSIPASVFPALLKVGRKEPAGQLSDMEKLSNKLYIAYNGLFLSFFFGGLLMPGGLDSSPGLLYRLLNFTTYGWTLLILFLTFRQFHPLYQNSVHINSVFKLLLPLLWLIILELVNGLIWTEEPGEFIRSLGWEFLPMLSIITALATGGCRQFRVRFAHMIAVQAFLGGLLAFYIITKYPIDFGRGNVSSPHFFALWMSNFSMLALANMSIYRPLEKLFAIVGFAFFATLTLSYQSRGGSITLFIIYPTVLAITMFKAGRIRRALRSRTVILSILSIGLLLYFLGESNVIRQAIDTGLKGTTQRLYGGADQSNVISGIRDNFLDEIERSRGAEAMEFISRSTIYTWLLGNGWGGSWKSKLMAYGGDWYVVHFGPLHMVLKGGLFLSAFYLFVILAALHRAWQSLKYDPLAVGSFCYLFSYLMEFTKHGPVGHSYNFYVLWATLGIALSCQPKSPNIYS